MNISPTKNYSITRFYPFCRKHNETNANKKPAAYIQNEYVNFLPYAKPARKLPVLNERRKFGQIILNGRVFNRHVTFYARKDLDWIKLGQYLKEKFPHIEDVDIHCFGCSSGEEAYTIAILLKSLYKDRPFKINASDISDDMIMNNKINQKKGVRLKKYESEFILKTGLGIETKTSDELYIPINSETVEIKPEIVNSIEFSTKNILTSLDDIDETRPSIIFCRNMWPYIDSKYYDEFAKSLYEKLAPGSIVVLGSYDCNGQKGIKGSNMFPLALHSSGFKRKRIAIGKLCNRSLIFEKK